MAGQDIQLGKIIRVKRKELGFTLDTLSKKSGIAKTTISKIERDIISPSFNTLAKIARGMNLKVTRLIEENSDKDIILIRKKDRKTTLLNGRYNKIQTLTRSSASMDIEVVQIMIKSGRDTGMDPPHEGEEIIICLKGKVVFQNGNKAYELFEGDSIHFKPIFESGLFNKSSEDAEIVWIYNSSRLFLLNGQT